MRAHYERFHREGVALSMPVQNMRFEVSETFDPAWGVNAVCWLAGGAESYRFADGRRMRLGSGGILTLSRHERYAYETECDFLFRTNMIVFSDEIARRVSLAADPNSLDHDEAPGDGAAALMTRLSAPAPAAAALLASLAASCRSGDHEPDRADERAALLFAELLLDERRLRGAAAALPAIKRSTRNELARRAGLAAAYMHECYGNAALSLGDIAREARLSRYHFVRVFRDLYGATPIEYLTELRLDAAARLLVETRAPVGGVGRAAGFSDRTAFYRRFRRRFGIAPADYRAAQH